MIPLFRPALDAETIAEALARMSRSMESGYIGEGPVCAEFERELAKQLDPRALPNAPLPLYVNSCTSALRLAYVLAGAGPGRNVVCTPMTCLATATAILETGASIRWCDVDPLTGNIDPVSAVLACDENTMAVVAVDWAGRVADFGALNAELVRAQGEPDPLRASPLLIEDAAHAFGAIGPFRGDLVAYSFQAIKHVTSADGGALVCLTPAQRDRARLLRWFGLDRTKGASMRCLQSVPEPGFKLQGNDVLAGLGLASLAGAPKRLEHHRQLARVYHNMLRDQPNLTLAPYDSGCSYWFFPVLVAPGAVEGFVEHMAIHGVEVGQVHARLDTQTALAGVSAVPRPGLDAFVARQVNLPVGAHVTDPWPVVRAVQAWRG